MAEANLSSDQLERYARQIVLDGFGAAAQAALRGASVLVVGAGGLGSPAILYLAGAGVGRLVVVDDDVVERSNLQRQFIHGEGDVGRPKVESAADRVRSYNPDVRVEPVEATLGRSNVAELLDGVDAVVDATDRFESRFLLNDACVLTDTPFVHGAIHRFEGQLLVYDPDAEGPCYRCLFREAPPPGAVPDCATAGVLGPVPGVIGSLEAVEAIKLLTGVGRPATGRLLAVDTFSFGFDQVTVRRDPACPVCGDDPVADDPAELTYGERSRLEPGRPSAP